MGKGGEGGREGGTAEEDERDGGEGTAEEEGTREPKGTREDGRSGGRRARCGEARGGQPRQRRRSSYA